MQWRRVLHRLVNLAPVKWMLTESRLLSRLFFEWRYRSPDPYGVRSDEERGKYDHAFSLVGAKTYRRGLDLGCGEGWHTTRLSRFCREVVGVDLSRRAVARARRRCRPPSVEYRVVDVARDELPGPFDYIFCGETLYYLRRSQLPDARTRILASLEDEGVLHLLHSRALGDDVTGLAYKEFGARTVHGMFGSADELRIVRDEQSPLYRVTVFRKRGGRPREASGHGTAESDRHS